MKRKSSGGIILKSGLIIFGGNHHISDEVVDAIHWHNDPAQAKESLMLAAAIQISDRAVTELRGSWSR